MSDYVELYKQRTPFFDGKEEAFLEWRTRFQSFAVSKQFSEALVPAFDALLPTKEDTVLDDTVAAQKAQGEAKTKNSIAMSAVSEALKGPVSIGILYDARCDDWPDVGKAWKVMSSLDETYLPNDLTAKAFLLRDLLCLKWNEKDPPFVLRQEIANVQNKARRIKAKFPEEFYVMAVHCAVPRQYNQLLISTESRRMSTVSTSGGTTSNAKLSPLFKALTEAWKLSNRSKFLGNGSELYLFACYRCGKEGHKAKDCGQFLPKESKMTAEEMKGDKQLCTHCGRKGHDKSKCWDLEANASKRPEWWQLEANASKRPEWWNSSKHGKKSSGQAEPCCF